MRLVAVSAPRWIKLSKTSASITQSIVTDVNLIHQPLLL